jgi:hypothetical protein
LKQDYIPIGRMLKNRETAEACQFVSKFGPVE